MILILAGWCGVASAADSRSNAPPRDLLWQRWTREHGLPDNRVEQVVQTRDGHVWVTTPTGLARFDGRHWETLHRASLPSWFTNKISGLIADAERGLWIKAGYDLVRWNGRAFSRKSLGSTNTLAVGVISPCANGGVWAAKGNGIGLVRDESQDFRRLPLRLDFRNIKSLWERDDNLWIGFDCGLLRLDLRTGVFHEVRSDPGHDCKPLERLTTDAQGGLWGLELTPKPFSCRLVALNPKTEVGVQEVTERTERERIATSQSGQSRLPSNSVEPTGSLFPLLPPVKSVSAFRLNEQGGTIHREFPVYNASAPLFLLSDRHGQLWFPGGKGRIAFLRQGQRFDVALPPAAAEDVALAMAEDAEGGLWVATEDSGLLRFRPSKVRSLSIADGLPNPSVWALLDARDGSRWIGTDGGVSRWHDGGFTHWTERERLSRNAVRALAEDADGRIWIGTGSGLNWIEHGRLSRYRLPGDWVNSKIRAVIAGRDRTVWVGTARGLHCVRLGATSRAGNSEALDTHGESTLPFTFTAPGPAPGATPSDVLTLFEDRAGTVWVGTLESGLCRVRGDILEPATTSDGFKAHSVWAVHEDEAGALWLGTDRGLARLKDNRSFRFNPTHGLHDDFVNHIAQDDLGNLWLSGERGIYRLAKRDLDDLADGRKPRVEPVAYDEDEGLQTHETNGRKNQPGILRTRDGHLWFATARGVAIFNPRDLPDQTHPPPVALTRILASGQTVFDDTPVPGPVSGTNLAAIDPSALSAALPAGAGHALEVHYTASTFVAADKLRFQHRLEGLEQEWSDAGTRRVAQYANLKPGHYRFHVRAANKYGVWNQTGATFGFTLAPFFWQTGWFKTLAILTPLVAGLGWYRWRLTQHRRHAEAQRRAAIATERAEIARDLHDHLGARLTLVQHLSQALDATAASARPGEAASHKLADLARELNASLDSAVWAVQPDKDTLGSLVDYLGDTFHDLLKGTGIELELDFPDSLPAWPLSRTARYHLALIAVEALNNALKHARPKVVRLRLETGAGAFKLQIADDGCGFDPAATTSTGRTLRGGHGLANMRQRMESLGGRCEVSSAPGHGTTVTLTLNPEIGHG